MNTKTQEKLSEVSSNPYQNHFEHLTDELRWLNRMILIQVLRLRQQHFYEKLSDFRDLFISDEEINALLAAGVFENDNIPANENYSQQINILLSQAEVIRQNISQRITASQNQNIFLPFVQLQRIFGLSAFEMQSLLICLAPQMDSRYEKLYAYLQNDLTKKSASIDLLLKLQCSTIEARLEQVAIFHPDAALRNFHLLEVIPENNSSALIDQLTQINSRIFFYIIGISEISSELRFYLTYFQPLSWDDVVVNPELKNRLRQLFVDKWIPENGNQELVQKPMLYLYGHTGVGKKTILRALCGELGIGLAVCDLRMVLSNNENFQRTLRLILREGLLYPCAICFDHFEKLIEFDAENPGFLVSFSEEISKSGWIKFVSSEQPLPGSLLAYQTYLPVEIPAPDHQAQKNIWEMQLQKRANGKQSLQVTQLSQFFDLTGAQIEHAVRLAIKNAAVREPNDPQITLNDLFFSSRIQSQPKLSTLARKINPKYHWDDIILPQNQLQQLKELANQVKYKQVVMEDWGFANKLSLGHGLNALFAGPSGTGKTMAAEVIANELGLDLYKIDLSAVVSKYIGETEKNLNNVFTEAEHSNCILFFDEADALLGKRSEVKDAHDRYANIEIAYLLQKMEEFKGVTILATNSRRNIDDAFTRRIRFIIEFPFPEAEYRLVIWQVIFPKETPLEKNIDFHFFAKKFKISGGNIKNIALSAAFYAANDGQLVTMEHLIQATKQELQKIGKLYVKTDFEDYGHLV